jgi:ClpP class serine protease
MIQSEVERIEALFSDKHFAAGTVLNVTSEAVPLKMTPGPVATIQVNGPLMPKRSAFLDFFDVEHTAYGEIRAQVAEAQERGAKRIDFVIDSPGGDVNGLYETMADIDAIPVKTRTLAGSTLASAAYMLASQTGTIIAENDISIVGSVGVATSAYVSENVKEIANTDSPKKRPDARTEEGVQAVQAELDDIFQVLAEKIAEGRGVSVDTVKNDYGQGAIMTARTALRMKMIDSIGITQKQPAKTAAIRGDEKMNLAELKADNGALYREVLAIGAKEERDRVEAHLVMSDASGDIKTARESILSGEGMTASCQAKHLAAGINKKSIALRSGENAPPVEGGVEPPAKDPMKAMVEEMTAGNKDLIMEV